MKRNFEFDGISVVRWRDGLIDLHNAYDLKAFGTDMGGSEVRLSFDRNEHAINPAALPATVTLHCTGNVRVSFNDLTSIAAPLTEEGIEIAYFDEGCDWSSFLDEDLARNQNPTGLHISFINGFVVRVICEAVTLDTK